MTNIKLFIIMSASLITLASVAFQSINVVENFESPFFYRCMIVTFKIVEWIVSTVAFHLIIISLYDMI